jgi:hypothetical protein
LLFLLKKEKEIELKEANESLINNRLSSLQQTFEIKINAIDETIKKLKQGSDKKADRILRMKESQKINLTRNFNNKIAELEANRKVFLRLHNVEFFYYSQLFQGEKNLFKKFYFLNESMFLRQYEYRLPDALPIIAVSQKDAAFYRDELDKRNTKRHQASRHHL